MEFVYEINQDLKRSLQQENDSSDDSVELEDQATDLDGFKKYSEDLDQKTKKSTKRVSRGAFIHGHLSSPIVRDELDFLLCHEEMHCERHKKLKKKLTELNIERTGFDHNCEVNQCLENVITSNFMVHRCENKLKKAISCAVKNTAINVLNTTHLKQFPSVELKNYLFSKIPLLIDSYRRKITAETIKDRICYKEIKFGEFIELSPTIIIDQDVIIYYCTKSKEWLFLPMTSLICLLDNYQSEFSLLIYWLICDFFKKYNTSMFERGREILSFWRNLRSSHKNKTYKMLANWEALITGFIISKQDDLGFKELLEEAKSTISGIEKNFDYNFFFSKLENDNDIKLEFELLGLNKFFGHPVLNVDDGLQVIHKHATKKVIIDEQLAKKVRQLFRRDFCFEYYKKEHKWPEVEIDKLDDRMKKYFQDGIRSHKLMNLPLEAWETVKFRKTFDMDYCPDTSVLLKDSAISVPRECWAEGFDHCAFKNLYGKNKPKLPYYPEKRVLLRYLEGSERETEEKIKELDENIFDPNDMIAIICRKERELNLDGRYFVKQTYRQRLAQTCGEKNISDSIMRYIPEQTMTNSEIEIMLKHCAAVKGLQLDWEVIVIDFQKWNMCFRHPLVKLFGIDLDLLFGLNYFYTNSHLWFTNSWVFTNSRVSPPDVQNDEPIEGKNHYRNHLGGMEGMHQKKWTLIQTKIIRFVAFLNNLKISVYGQGDNQVIMIRYTNAQKANRVAIRNKFLEMLQEYCSALNLTIKPKETWYSKNMFEYGKQRYFKGQAISSSTKKICRLISDINDGSNTFMTSQSTINTVTESSAKGDLNPLFSFIVNQVEHVHFLFRNKIINENTTDDKIVALLNYSNVFGGMNLSCLFQHGVRGHDDKLTLWLSIYLTIKNDYPEVYKYLLQLTNLAPRNTVNYASLLEDIFSINIDRLPSAEQYLRKLVSDYLEGANVKNPEIKKLYVKREFESKDKLVEALMSIYPFYPSLAKELFRFSNEGLLIQRRNQFTNIQTINKTVQQESEENFLTIIKEIDSRSISILIRKLNSNSRDNYLDDFLSESTCPTKIAKIMRKYYWKIDMVGETKPFAPHQIKLSPLDSVDNSDFSRSIVVTISKEFTASNLGFVEKLGPFKPYVGSTTHAKIKRPNIDIKADTDQLKALQQLAGIRTWMISTGSEKIVPLIDMLIAEKNDIIPKELKELDYNDWCASIYGGNPVHRLFSVVEKSAGLINFLPIVGSHFQMSTDNMEKFMHGGKDYTIFFQLIYVYIQYLLICYKLLGKKIEGTYLAVLECEDCTFEITNVKFDLTKPLTKLTEVTLNTQLTQYRLNPSQYSPEILTNLVSFFMGIEIGKKIDESNFENYQTDFNLEDESSAYNIRGYGITEFRYSNLSFLIAGIIYSSLTVKRHISFNHQILEVLNSNSSCAVLSHLIMCSNRQQEVIQFLECSGNNHFQLTNNVKMSPMLLNGIINYFKKNYDSIIKIVSSTICEDEGEKEIVRRLTFCQKYYNFFRTKKYKIKFTPVSFDKSELFKRFREIHKLINFNKLLYRFNIKRDSLISEWRLKLVEEKYELPIAKFKTRKLKKPSGSKASLSIELYCSIFNNMLNTSKPYEVLETGIKNIHHLARPLGNISSSASKFLEILTLFQIEEEFINKACFLAEGSGSMALITHLLFNCPILFNTLMDPEVDPRISGIKTYPTAFMNKGLVNDKILPYSKELTMGETNILENIFIGKIKKILSDIGNEIHLFSIDAESKEERSNYIFLKTYLPIIVDKCKKIKYIFIKIFPSQTGFEKQIDFIRSFPNIDFVLVKPLSSHPNNKEAYLIIFNKLNIYYKCKASLIEFQRCGLSDLTLNMCNKVILYNTPTYTNYTKYVLLVGKNLILTNKYFNLDMEYNDMINQLKHKGYICGIWCKEFLRSLFIFQSQSQSEQDPSSLLVFHALYRNYGKEKIAKIAQYLIKLSIYWTTNRGSVEDKMLQLVTEHFTQQGEIIKETEDFHKLIFKHIHDPICQCNLHFTINLPKRFGSWLRTLIRLHHLSANVDKFFEGLKMTFDDDQKFNYKPIKQN